MQKNENTIVYKVNKELKLEEILRNNLNFSGRLFRKLYKRKLIKVNDKYVNKRKLCSKGDIIKITMEDEKNVYTPKYIPLDIVYEDFDILIINKEPNIVVHPSKSNNNNTLANGIAYYFKENNINKKVRLVNRLDMNTSGLLVVAKNPFGHQQMALQFEKKSVKKTYLALVKGILEIKSGTIDKPIGKDKMNPIKNIVSKDGKKSITRYKVLKRYKDLSLLEVEIITGRTHQIRVHLDYINHPIIGDTLYNESSKLIKRQALHSYSLTFNKPRTNEKLKIKAKLPTDMEKVIKYYK
ncbi:MAG: RluA family pseudouridine synthase [Firmicutes bacterium]|nr:RluA family pseudouridine synthase [Bacillota bacterium]